MTPPLGILVYHNTELQFAVDCHGAVEIGRNKGHETLGFATDAARLVIASPREKSIAREQARIEPLADGRFRLTNVSKTVVILLPDGTPLAPGEGRDLP